MYRQIVRHPTVPGTDIFHNHVFILRTKFNSIVDPKRFFLYGIWLRIQSRRVLYMAPGPTLKKSFSSRFDPGSDF
jgi:hypothetical protein